MAYKEKRAGHVLLDRMKQVARRHFKIRVHNYIVHIMTLCMLSLSPSPSLTILGPSAEGCPGTLGTPPFSPGRRSWSLGLLY